MKRFGSWLAARIAWCAVRGPQGTLKHMEQEENDRLPRFLKEVTPAARLELAKNYGTGLLHSILPPLFPFRRLTCNYLPPTENAKTLAPTRPHPAAPNKPPFAGIASGMNASFQFSEPEHLTLTFLVCIALL